MTGLIDGERLDLGPRIPVVIPGIDQDGAGKGSTDCCGRRFAICRIMAGSDPLNTKSGAAGG